MLDDKYIPIERTLEFKTDESGKKYPYTGDQFIDGNSKRTRITIWATKWEEAFKKLDHILKVNNIIWLCKMPSKERVFFETLAYIHHKIEITKEIETIINKEAGV